MLQRSSDANGNKGCATGLLLIVAQVLLVLVLIVGFLTVAIAAGWIDIP